MRSDALIGLELDDVLEGNESAPSQDPPAAWHRHMTLPALTGFERAAVLAAWGVAPAFDATPADTTAGTNEALQRDGFKFKITIIDAYENAYGFWVRWKCSCRSDCSYANGATAKEAARKAKKSSDEHRHKKPVGWVPGITPTMLEVDRERRKRIVVCETVAAITPHLRAVTKRRVPARRCIVLVVCETVAAITPHLRRVTDEHPIRLSGHSNKPKALCGREINWDTKLPLSSARCALCLKAAHEAVSPTR